MRRSLSVLALASTLPLAAMIARFGPESPPAALFHPHFPKTIEVQLNKQLSMKVRHITVTYNKKGAEEADPGFSWHLGGASFETTSAVQIGGHEFEAGTYSLKVRKTEDSGWDLVLDDAGRFQAKLTENAKVLTTAFDADATLFEHLSIDLQPSGDKDSTKLYLDVRFDTNLARCEIVVPAAKAADKAPNRDK